MRRRRRIRCAERSATSSSGSASRLRPASMAQAGGRAPPHRMARSGDRGAPLQGVPPRRVRLPRPRRTLSQRCRPRSARRRHRAGGTHRTRVGVARHPGPGRRGAAVRPRCLQPVAPRWRHEDRRATLRRPQRRSLDPAPPSVDRCRLVGLARAVSGGDEGPGAEPRRRAPGLPDPAPELGDRAGAAQTLADGAGISGPPAGPRTARRTDVHPGPTVHHPGPAVTPGPDSPRR